MNHKCPVLRQEQAQRQDKSIYWTGRWRKLRLDVLDSQEYVCLWSLYVDGKVRECNVCHHIVEIEQDYSQAYEVDNLIGVEGDVHKRIHALYKIDKYKTIKIIKECKRLWDDGIKLEGLGKLRELGNKIK